MLATLFLTLFMTGSPDSLRTETIQGKVYVIHQVGEKETLYSLSKRYGTTVQEILTQNPTADAGLEIGQILRIPYTPKARTAAPVSTPQGLVHKVAPGETLFAVARHYNVSVDDLRSWNNLKDGQLSAGQELLIKKKETEQRPTAQTTATTPATAGAKTHTVAAKETLFSIARQYSMTVQQLREWNGLTDNELKIGQVLAVSAPASVNSVSTTPPATTQTTTTVPNSTPVRTQPLPAVERVSGSDELKESGTATLMTGTEGTRKYLAYHATIKAGEILRIRNLSNNQEVFVRVTGTPPNPDSGVMIWISKSAWDMLGATENFRAEITYYK